MPGRQAKDMNTNDSTQTKARHILFVDDEAPTRELVAMHLCRRGYVVTTAMTAGEGRSALAQKRFDLAVLDVDLAGENGMDLLSYCKAQDPQLPIIIFTGMNFNQDLVREARDRGADGCMSKVQPLSELAAEVERLIK
jgi:DNA-binding response OmpR family regulator